MNAILRYSYALLAVAGLMTASSPLLATAAPEPTPAQLTVEDHARLFTPEKIPAAKAIVAQSMGRGSRQVHFETYEAMSEQEAKDYDLAKGDNKRRSELRSQWAHSKAKAEGDRGISIFICMKPAILEILVDRQMHDHQFTDEKRNKLSELILNHLKAADKKTGDEKRAEFDAALMDAAEYLKVNLPASLLTSAPARHNDVKQDNKNQVAKDDQPEGTHWGKWICIGVVVLLGLWLVIGLIRAFTGGGSGGGGAGGGPGGGGGGGGGFMSGLMGGLFGAMAGMWIYNSMFGDHHSSSSAFGGDNPSGGDYGGGESGGAGDYGGDQGGGGDWGGSGGGGGGDTGGGGDWGGGGDAGGGGGGDWGGGGGGGGDFGGGGGDF